MKTFLKSVWYLDDNNVKHITVVHSRAELIFLRERFDFSGTLEDFLCEA
jgi:hypothetical protein